MCRNDQTLLLSMNMRRNYTNSLLNGASSRKSTQTWRKKNKEKHTPYTMTDTLEISIRFLYDCFAKIHESRSHHYNYRFKFVCHLAREQCEKILSNTRQMPGEHCNEIWALKILVCNSVSQPLHVKDFFLTSTNLWRFKIDYENNSNTSSNKFLFHRSHSQISMRNLRLSLFHKFVKIRAFGRQRTPNVVFWLKLISVLGFKIARVEK